MSHMLTRPEAWALLTAYNQDHFHLRHAVTVEGVMRYFANELCYGDEADFWATVGLLHDLDFEQFPQQHCIKEQEILSKRPSWPCGAAKTPASRSDGGMLC